MASSQRANGLKTGKDIESGREDSKSRWASSSRLLKWLEGLFKDTSSSSQTIEASRSNDDTLANRATHNLESREGHAFVINEDDVFQITQQHVQYSCYGTTLKGLAKFDNCADYGIPEAAENRLLKIEIARLVKTVSDDGAQLFVSNSLLQDTTPQAYEELSSLADQIWCNMDIIEHDNAIVAFSNISGDLTRVANAFTTSRDRLTNRLMEDETGIEGSAPTLLAPPARNQELYFALVDYVIGSVGRLIVRTAISRRWHQETLSILAQWSMKLKVLAKEPKRYAKISLDAGVDAVQEKKDLTESREGRYLVITTSDGQASIDPLDIEPDLSFRYYREKTHFRHHIFRLLKLALDGLVNPPLTNNVASCFESCTHVYRTGMEGLTTTLSSDRYGQISASSDPFMLKSTYTALELCRRNILISSSSAGATARTMSGAENEDNLASVSWNWIEGEADVSQPLTTFTTSSMDTLISILVPLSLASTFVSVILDTLVTLALNGEEEEDPIMQFVPPAKNFQALFTVTTAEWNQRRRKLRRSKYTDRDVQPVSLPPMRLGIRPGTNIAQLLAQAETMPQRFLDSWGTEVTTQYEEIRTQLEKWVISERSITIDCRRYVTKVLLIAVAIVCGAMAIPFAVGARIHGVDPFQLTTFAWLIAGFVIILAKSHYVTEWGWHDFLKGRVVCRSLSNVSNVTKVDPQMILMYLLLEERINTLKTQGPYNGMFRRKAEGLDGFIIDVPAHVSTMLASGFVILKVLNEYGEHLICLDVRKGTTGDSPMTGRTETYLTCPETRRDEDRYNIIEGATGYVKGNSPPSSAGKIRSSKHLDRVKKLTLEEIHWFRVLGLYVRDARFG